MRRPAAVLLAVLLVTVMVFPVAAEDIGVSGSAVRHDVPANITEISAGPNLPPIPLEGTYYIFQDDTERAEAGLEKAYYTRDGGPDYDVWRVSKSKLGIREDEDDVIHRATAIQAAVNSCFPDNYAIETTEDGKQYGYFTGYEDKSQAYPGIVYLDQWYIVEDGEDIVSVVRRWKCDKINPVVGKNLQMVVPRCLTEVGLSEMDHMNGISLSYVFPGDSDMPKTMKIASYPKDTYNGDQFNTFAEMAKNIEDYDDVKKQLQKGKWDLHDLGLFYTTFYKVQRQFIVKNRGCDVLYLELLDPVDQENKYTVLAVEFDDYFVEVYCVEPIEGNTYVPLALEKGISCEQGRDPAAQR